MEKRGSVKTITDGFGNYWSIQCPLCGTNTMIVIRPGGARCSMCDSIIKEEQEAVIECLKQKLEEVENEKD